MTEDNITRFPIKPKKAAPEDRTLVRPWEIGKPRKCDHPSFVVDDALAEVECAICAEKLNPMWVLTRLASHDMKFHDAAERYRQEMARLSERTKTKCEHCDRMTRISHR